jgi:hypothetical protein
MKLMVVGGGGREHAIIKKLRENPTVTEIYALPGNGGIARDATCVDIGAKDIDGIVKFAVEHAVDYAVVAPDDPLVLGAVDALTAQLGNHENCYEKHRLYNDLLTARMAFLCALHRKGSVGCHVREDTAEEPGHRLTAHYAAGQMMLLREEI